MIRRGLHLVYTLRRIHNTQNTTTYNVKCEPVQCAQMHFCFTKVSLAKPRENSVHKLALSTCTLAVLLATRFLQKLRISSLLLCRPN